MPIPKGYEAVEEIPQGYEPVEVEARSPSIDHQDVMGYFRGRTEAGFDPLRTMVTGAAAEVPAGLAGIAQSVNPFAEPGAGAQAVQSTRQALTAQPSTGAGREALQRFGETIQPVSDAFQAAQKGAGEIGYEYGGPVGGAIAETIPTAAMMAVSPVKNLTKIPKRAVAKVIPESTPVGMYESAAKFSTTIPKAKRIEMSETALKYGIMPTGAGLDKLAGMVTKFDAKITGLIDDATASGKTIPKGAIYKHLKGLRREMGGTKVGAAKNLRQIDKAAKEIDLQLKSLKKDRLTPNELQDIKQSAYKQVSYEGRQLRAQAGTEAATKAIAKGAKEAIEGVTDVKGLNKELGRLLELEKPLSRSAARIENRNIVGIDAPIKIGAGQAAGGPAGAVAGTGLSILEHPKIKASLAIKLRNLQNSGQLELIDTNLVPVLIKYGLLQAATESPAADVE